MSVIAHWIENAGINTVVIGLVREHLVKIKPPRALWVPFELGRPIGAPLNSDFQTRVLKAALTMTTHQPAEAWLCDFDAEDPRSTPDALWQAPAVPLADSVANEVEALGSAYRKFVDKHNRTSVGVAGISIARSAEIMDTLKSAEPTQSPRADTSPVLMARYVIDDLKSYYIEAALSSGSPDSDQINRWLWQQTHLGEEIQKLRQRWMGSDKGKLNFVGERFLIPHKWRIA